MHEVGYTVVALGKGRFRFGTPYGVELPEGGFTAPRGSRVAPAERPAPVGGRPHPVWGGERIDLRLLIDGMVANTVNASGRRLPDVPVSEVPDLLRDTIGWPMYGAA